MRPVRLDLDGFASFREPTTVDFTNADYFALVGPTGAGKSTVIDAITFALFGTVPRWDNKHEVRNALAPTANRGTVRLIFDLDGDRYVVARELRRARQGNVQQKNIRLERFDDPTAAGDIDDSTEVLAADGAVTPAVEELLGLTFDHFTQCVVLPQGDFAAFLHAKGSARRSMLLKLLGADLYSDIGKRANTRASLASGRAQGIADQLTRLGDATEEAQALAERRAAELIELTGRLSDPLSRLAEAEAALAEAQQTSSRLAAECEQLTALTVPAGLDELDDRLRAAGEQLEAAEAAEEAAQAADTAARTARDAAPPRRPLEQAGRDYTDRERLRADLPGSRAAVQEATGLREETGRAHRQATSALETARTARDEAIAAARESAERVTSLTAEIDLLHGVAVPAVVPALDERLRDAAAALREADLALAGAEQAEEAARGALDAAGPRLPLERARDTLDELGTAQQAVDELTVARQQAKEELTQAEAVLRQAADNLSAARAHRDAAAVADGAAALRAHLELGQPCPVCEQPVAVLPAPADASQLAAADAAVTAAGAAHTRAQQGERVAAQAIAVAAGKLDAATGRVHTLTAALDGQPQDPEAVHAALERLDQLAAAARQADAVLRQVRGTRTAAQTHLGEVEAEATELRAAFGAARDPLVALGAPAGDGPLLASWTALADWAAAQAAARGTKLADAQQHAARTAGERDTADRHFTAAEAEVTTRREAESRAVAAFGSATAALWGLEQRLAELDAALAGAPPADAVAAALREVNRLDVEAHTADEQLRDARTKRRHAQQALDGLTAENTTAWQALRAARDRLVALGAPELTAATVRAGWTDLLGWASDQATAHTTALATARGEVTAAEQHRGGVEQELTEMLAEHGLTPEPGPLARTAPVVCASAVEQARAEARRIAERCAEAADLALQHADAITEQQVAKMLGNLLRSDKFPEWLEAAALDTLVLAASESLAELSGGQFELTHRAGEFYVVDHADADSERSVRTLSGGETFQASLALALALSSQLSTLAADGAARLDSIFLDEGFGTLDEGTLEVVAGTLENLASGDRMVGIITHVTALAERVPVRYAVTRTARTSTIIREGA